MPIFVRLNPIRNGGGDIVWRYLREYTYRKLLPSCGQRVNDTKNYMHSIPVRKLHQEPNLVKYSTKAHQDTNIKLEELLKSSKDQTIGSVLPLCGKLLRNEPPNVRAKLCENLWNYAKSSDYKLTVEDYNVYIQTCTENEVLLNGKTWLDMLGEDGSMDTYRLLIENNCTQGNVAGAFEILKYMKYKNYAIDKNIFDSLVLGHTLVGGIKEIENVLDTMSTAQIVIDNKTYWNILRGLATRNSLQEFQEFLDSHKLEIVDNSFLDILLRLGSTNKQYWLPKLMSCLNVDVVSRYLSKEIENVCIQLISRNHWQAAIFIYTQLIDSVNQENYGTFLLEEMLRKNIGTNNVIEMSVHIKEKNPYILENVLLCAMQNKYFDLAWKVLENLEILRCHYFWPLLIEEGNKSGEIGIFDVLKRMTNLNVKLDSDTLEYYCFSFCEKSNPTLLIRKFESINVDLKTLVSSLFIILLKDGQMESVAEFCDQYNLVLPDVRLLKVLANVWYNTRVTKDNLAIKILQKAYESNPNQLDTVGVFLVKATKLCRSSSEMDDLLSLIKMIESKKFRISPDSYENIMSILRFKSRNCDFPQELEDALRKLLDPSMSQDVGHIKHPRNMNVDELEDHLVELESKNMETRGLLRKLIIEHCRLGNIERVKQLQEKFIGNGYKESAGIKGVMLHTYMENEHLEPALSVYEEIKAKHPKFSIDDFKIINLATLLIKRGKFSDALDLIENESENKLIKGGKAIERNCWKLLSTIEEPVDVKKALDLLIRLRYCKPTNIILGPLIKVHLKRNELDAAVAEYKRLAEKYRCTPLQLELMVAIIKSGNKKLLEECVDVTTKVHGIVMTRLSLLAALAENQLENPITKLLSEKPIIPRNELNRRYERWIFEEKLFALWTVAKAAKKLPPDIINIDDIHLAMIKGFSLKNDCEGAVQFWMELMDEEVNISDEVHHQILSLLERCNYDIPKNLLSSD